jgi:hypothetical protein
VARRQGVMDRARTNGATRGGQAPPQAGQAAPQAMRPFVAGTRRIDEPIYDASATLGASSVDLPTLEVDPNGFLAGLWILVEGTVAGQTVATVVYNADAPFNVLDLVNFQDTNSQPLVGPMNGYDLYLVDKYGGYHFQGDAKASPIFLQDTAGADGGSFTFALWVPGELVRRDAMGALPNKSASSTFSINFRLAPSTTVYSTPPNVLPTVRVRVLLEGWQDPNLADIRGNPVTPNPPGVQTTQYWHKQNYTLASGSLNQRLLGIDSLVRNLIFVARDENNARAQGDTEFPDPFTLLYETSQIVNRGRTFWRHLIAAHYGYTAAAEAANGRDNGVYPLPFCLDFGLKPGAETRLGYLPVSSATNLVMSGTIGGAGANNYSLLVNKVVPAGGDPLQLTGGM